MFTAELTLERCRWTLQYVIIFQILTTSVPAVLVSMVPHVKTRSVGSFVTVFMATVATPAIPVGANLAIHLFTVSEHVVDTVVVHHIIILFVSS